MCSLKPSPIPSLVSPRFITDEATISCSHCRTRFFLVCSHRAFAAMVRLPLQNVRGALVYLASVSSQCSAGSGASKEFSGFRCPKITSTAEHHSPRGVPETPAPTKCLGSNVAHSNPYPPNIPRAPGTLTIRLLIFSIFNIHFTDSASRLSLQLQLVAPTLSSERAPALPTQTTNFRPSLPLLPHSPRTIPSSCPILR